MLCYAVVLLFHCRDVRVICCPAVLLSRPLDYLVLAC
jgi:hypothetical protein